MPDPTNEQACKQVEEAARRGASINLPPSEGKPLEDWRDEPRQNPTDTPTPKMPPGGGSASRWPKP